MIDDIRTVVWKERRERAGQHESFRGKIADWFFPSLSLGFLAIVPPLTLQGEWRSSAFTLVLSVLIPSMVAGPSMPDAIAGERERNTLNSLLATCLPDRASVLGKMVAAIRVALGATLVAHVAALATMNLVDWSGRVSLYEPWIALANAIAAVLVAVLAASLGLLMSIRATSVLPDAWREVFEGFITNVVLDLDPIRAFLVFFMICLLVDAGLIALVMARFRRARIAVLPPR